MKKRRMIAALLSAALVLGIAPAIPASRASRAFGAEGTGVQGDSGLLWLVNYGHSVSKDYAASDMRTAADSSVKMRAAAASALESMVKDLKNTGLSIRLNSGYRSYATQTYLFNTRLAARQKTGMSYEAAHAATRKFTAVPGTSEHQLGLAIDLSTDGTLTAAFGNTAQGKWLSANCWRYGFILRYRDEKYSQTQIGEEPWHFRYVGKPHAQIMYEKDWCLEEYIDWLKENGHISLTAGDMVYDVYRTAGDTSGYHDVIDRSSDNSGGVIVTTYHPADPMAYIRGHWSESSFAMLFGEEVPAVFGVIDPDRSITRGEFAALYAQQMENGKLPAAAQSPGSAGFSDVPRTDPYYSGITAAAAAGIMGGNGGRFRPEGFLTREEAAVAAAKCVKDDELQYLDYGDLGSISGWAFQSVQKLALHGIMKGSDGNFRPGAKLTWGEAAALLRSLEEYVGSADGGLQI